MSVDVEAWKRERVLRLERQVAGLVRYREQLERTLALAVTVAAGTSGVDVYELLAVLDSIANPVYWAPEMRWEAP